MSNPRTLSIGIGLFALAHRTLLHKLRVAVATFAIAMGAMYEICQILTDHVFITKQSVWYVSLVLCLVFGKFVSPCTVSEQG